MSEPSSPVSPTSPVSPISPDVARIRTMSGGSGEGRRSRSGSFSGINRVVVVAVDPSENAKFAFDCEFKFDFLPIFAVYRYIYFRRLIMSSRCLMS